MWRQGQSARETRRSPFEKDAVTMPTSDKLLADLTQLHPKLIDLSLGRIERLLERLGNPHEKLPPVVHVAGTNGKGSTCALLRAILEAAGLRIHVYTSPHLVRFHERICLAGDDGHARPIGESELVDVLTRTQAANEGNDITQFEITTAAALLAFSEHQADVLLLEVGLGGRLDATNVIKTPALTVITPVSIDHADKLGNTIEKIAAEKAGILKPQVPVVVAKQPDEALDVITRHAQSLNAPMTVWGQDFDAHPQHGRLVFQNESALLDLPLPALAGAHQVINAATAIAAALELRTLLRNEIEGNGGTGHAVDAGKAAVIGDIITEAAIEAGLTRAQWPGRMQHLTNGPLPDLLSPGSELWLDGGHNPAAGEAVALAMADLEERSPKPLFLVVGMMTLKDTHGFLKPFTGLVRDVVAVPVPAANVPPQEPVDLAKRAIEAGFSCRTETSVEAALKTLEKNVSGPKRILICGSLYLAGQVLAVQQGVEPQPN